MSLTQLHSIDWMPVDHFLLEYNSTVDPEYIHVELSPSQRHYTINNCSPGTKHSLILTSIDINGRAVVRAKPLIVETLATIERPVLKLLHNDPGAITIEWTRPKEYGHATIKEYFLQVNGKDYARIISTQTELTFTECRALRTYTFRLQAISTIPDCDSDFSHILNVTCPGAMPITLKRAHSRNVNKVKVAWNKPICQGGARIREYRIYYQKAENKEQQPSKDKIIDHPESILHTLMPGSVEDSLKVEPDKYYWAILEAEIVPDGCPNLVTSSVKLHATKRPVAPEISVDIYGLKERQSFDKEMAYLVDKRDRLKRNVNAMINSVLAKGERVRDEEVQQKRVILYRLERRIEDLLRIINEYTGTVPVVVNWKTPVFDEFSEPVGYRVLVNDEVYADNLPLDTKQYCMKASVNEPFYKITVTTLSGHSVGHSKPSEAIQFSSSEFRPVRFFCYFNSHKKQAEWPDSGSCRLEDTLSYEQQHSNKPFPQKSFISERIHAASFQAMSVFDGVWGPLGKHFGNHQTTALLFWTTWCASSKRAMEYFCSFAKSCSEKVRFLTCCVFSEEPMANHPNKVMNTMKHNNWNKDEGVQHFCACYPGPHSTLHKRDVENSSFTKFYKLLGVPTLVLIDGEGYIAWQGRVFGDNVQTFATYLKHTLAVIEKSDCSIRHCEHCDSERYGVLYSEKAKTTFSGKDLTMDQFNHMMKNQTEKLGKELALTYTRKTMNMNPAITTGEYDDSNSERIGEWNSSSATQSIKFSESPSPSFDGQSSRSSSQVSQASSRDGLGSTWSHSHFKEEDNKEKETLRRSKSVGFRKGSTQSTQSGSRTVKTKKETPAQTLPQRRAVSALPSVGHRQKVTIPARPKTSAPRTKRTKQYSWIRSQYSQDTYIPYNPYRGASYAKNGSVMSFYSQSGFLPKKPFPKDRGFPKVSRTTNMEIKKQKIPLHREIKYMRDGDWR